MNEIQEVPMREARDLSLPFAYDDLWKEVLRKPVLVVTDNAETSMLCKGVFRDVGFFSSTFLMDNKPLILRNSLREQPSASVVLDVFNDFQRVGAKGHSRTIGISSDGRRIQTSFHTGGESNDRFKYEKFHGIMGEVLEDGRASLVMVTVGKGALNQITRYSGVDTGGKVFYAHDPCYSIKQARTARKPEIVRPRPEFFRAMYDGIITLSERRLEPPQYVVSS